MPYAFFKSIHLSFLMASSIPKSHIFLTGVPGIGKTTLIKKLCECLKTRNLSVFGFYTEELRLESQRIGFDIVTLDGKRSPLARSNSNVRGPMVGKYTVDVNSFEGIVLPLLDMISDATSKCILIIDEIGKMELYSSKFKSKFTKIFNHKSNITVLGTIPLKRGNGIPFVENIREQGNVKVFRINKGNRDEIHIEILDMLKKCVVNEVN